VRNNLLSLGPSEAIWIGFNPKTHKSLVALQMDNNADDPELTFKDLRVAAALLRPAPGRQMIDSQKSEPL